MKKIVLVSALLLASCGASTTDNAKDGAKMSNPYQKETIDLNANIDAEESDFEEKIAEVKLIQLEASDKSILGESATFVGMSEKNIIVESRELGVVIFDNTGKLQTQISSGNGPEEIFPDGWIRYNKFDNKIYSTTYDGRIKIFSLDGKLVGEKKPADVITGINFVKDGIVCSVRNGEQTQEIIRKYDANFEKIIADTALTIDNYVTMGIFVNPVNDSTVSTSRNYNYDIINMTGDKFLTKYYVDIDQKRYFAELPDDQMQQMRVLMDIQKKGWNISGFVTAGKYQAISFFNMEVIAPNPIGTYKHKTVFRDMETGETANMVGTNNLQGLLKNNGNFTNAGDYFVQTIMPANKKTDVKPCSYITQEEADKWNKADPDGNPFVVLVKFK